MNRVDNVTRQQIHTILALSRSRGVDPVDILDRARLLRFPLRQREDQIEFMRNLVDSVRVAPVESIVPAGNRAPSNPMDAKNMVVMFLDRILEGLIKEKERK